DARYVPRDATCDLGAYEFKDFTKATITANTKPTVDQSTGWVTVVGSVTCSRDETLDVAVEISQEQKKGSTTSVVKAAGKVTVACTAGGKPWGLALAPSSGEFVVGDATVTAKTEAGPWIIPAAVTTAVKLSPGRK